MNKHEKTPTCNYLTNSVRVVHSTNWWELDNDYGICVNSLQPTRKAAPFSEGKMRNENKASHDPHYVNGQII